jgi:glycosyltransferase involved in cell wall biosynthesis
MEKPLVSIVMITYGHENYIIEAIEGVLMQEVNFPIELLIANDNSPDNTDLVVKNFLKNHPKSSIVKYIKHDENKGMMLNFIFALRQCTGDYIAICEGDDFWTNTNKLQLQVDFLEQNKNFVGSFHNVSVKNTFNKNESLFYSKSKKSSSFGINRIISKNPIPTLSVVFRKTYLQLTKDFSNFVVGDWPLHILIAQFGDYYYINKNMGCYRIHEGGVHQGMNNWDLNRKIRYTERLLYMFKSINKSLLKFNYVIRLRMIFDNIRLCYYKILSFK